MLVYRFCEFKPENNLDLYNSSAEKVKSVEQNALKNQTQDKGLNRGVSSPVFHKDEEMTVVTESNMQSNTIALLKGTVHVRKY